MASASNPPQSPPMMPAPRNTLGRRPHVQIDGEMHRLVFPAVGQYTTGTGAPPGPIDVSQHAYTAIVLLNTDSSNTVYIGSSASVNSASGFPLVAGASLEISSNDPSDRVRLCDIFIAGGGAAVVVAFLGVG